MRVKPYFYAITHASNGMKKLLCIVCFLMPAFLQAQDMNQEVNQLHAWLVQSEKVQLSDSVMNLIQQECASKQISERNLQRNLSFFKMLFNPEFDTHTRIKIANIIIGRFEETPEKIPLDLVRNTKRYLIQKTTK